MDIKQIDLRIRDFGDFTDNDLGAKVQLLGQFLVMLIIRPEYQREFRYPVEKQKAVILSILKGRPLNTVYFAKNADGTFEVIDGQQRTLSILNFNAGNFSVEFNGDTLYYHNLTEDIRAKFDDYIFGIRCDHLMWMLGEHEFYKGTGVLLLGNHKGTLVLKFLHE